MAVNVKSLKDTLNLPKTSFPMRANLVEREPKRIEAWEKNKLYASIQEKNSDGELFVLHDGPPFTNGNIHLGTALNKILKDIVLRYKSMKGFKTPFVPGWDCHGLPIEHKVIKENEALKSDSTKLRKACAKFSDKYIKIQQKQFKRLGVIADWENEYKTKTPAYEAEVLKVFAEFVRKGLVYRQKKPVYWSIPCKTALAEAEVEYKMHTSTSVFVKFPFKDKKFLDDEVSVVIWTTTPWTLPANRAIALSPKLNYVVLKSEQGNFLVAEGMAEDFAKEVGLEEFTFGQKLLGSELEGQVAYHPFIDGQETPIVLADYVNLDAGTGCVHTAPGHGADDYLTALKYGLEIYCPLDDDGCFLNDPKVPSSLVGLSVASKNGSSAANKEVINLLKANDALLKQSPYEHSYPHCWRSKAPIIFRSLDQWFIRLEELKQDALEAVEKVEWSPSWGKTRISNFVEGRIEWCISRQRTWGVPLPAFFDEKGNPLLNAEIIERVADKVAKRGSNFWFESSAEEILEGIELPEEWRDKTLFKGADTLDVWIDSGCSHRAVLDKIAELSSPADLYLEGSDQHRGWFQSSLWTSLVSKGEAPYKQVLTHGFVVDEFKKKISKSEGNGKTAEDFVRSFGADVLRLWVASEDYRNDMPISDNIFKHVVTTYRSIRNSLRFQLGNLYDFSFENHAVSLEDLTELDKWALWKTRTLIEEVTLDYDAYAFHKVYQRINRFCSVTLSSIYHDILKDRLYTYGPDCLERRSSQTALHLILNTLIKLLAPILTFTADEAFAYSLEDKVFAEGFESVHLQQFPEVEEVWNFEEEGKRFEELLKIRDEVNCELEKARQNKTIGQSLDAKVNFSGNKEDEKMILLKKFQKNLEEYFIVSRVNLIEEIEEKKFSIFVEHADGVRCPRTWRWVDELVLVEGIGEVSKRCKSSLEN